MKSVIISVVKGSIFIDILLCKKNNNKKTNKPKKQQRFDKLIYSINTIIKHLTACKISVGLSFLNWNVFFYRVPDLMLPPLIQRYDKNHFIFDPLQNPKTRDWNFTGWYM